MNTIQIPKEERSMNNQEWLQVLPLLWFLLSFTGCVPTDDTPPVAFGLYIANLIISGGLCLIFLKK